MNKYSLLAVLVFIFHILKSQLLSFTPATGSPIALTASMRGAICRDVNNDGKTDILVASANSNAVYVLLGAGNGQFSQAPGSPITINSGPIYIALADFNSDQKLDMATANYYSGNVSIFIGLGTGSFTPIPGSPFTTGYLPYCIDVADFNMDGKVDLITTNAGNNNVMFFWGNGNGTFNQSAIPLATGTMPYHVSTGFFNSDNFPDFAVANGVSNSVSVFLGTGTGLFNVAPGSPYAVGSQPRTIRIHDLNQDGRVDLVVPNALSNNAHILLGSSNGSFSNASGSPISVNTYPYQAAISDFDNDGFFDIAVSNCVGNAVNLYRGNGTGSFTPTSNSPFLAGFSPQTICSADFNGDGRDDLALGEWSGNYLNILLNNPCSEHIQSSITTATNLCTGLTVQFHTTTTNANNYSWNFGDPSSTSDTSSATDPTYTFPSYGTYTVSFNVNGKCESITVKKVIRINPLLAPQLPSTYSSCFKNNQLTFNLGGAIDPTATYTWFASSVSGNPGTHSNPFNASFNATASQTISVVVSQFGCKDSLSSNLSFINPIAAVNLDTLNCNDLFLHFINLSSDATAYSWNFGVQGNTADTSVVSNPTFTYPAYQNYTITLIASNGSCKDTLNQEIHVFPKFTLLPFASQAAQCFKYNLFDLSANAVYSGNPQFDWMISSPDSDLPFSTQNISGLHLPSPGTYTVTLNLNQNGCTKTRSELLHVLPQPGTTYSLNKDTACTPAVFSFHFLSDAAQHLSYAWKIDTTVYTTADPVYITSTPGAYSFSLNVINEFGCSDTIHPSQQLIVHASPTASMLVTPAYANMFDPVITFIDSTRYWHSTLFQFGDGSFSTQVENHHAYAAPGKFAYRLIVINNDGCSDTLTGNSVIDDLQADLIPNIFTPNHDGVNERFLIKGDFITGSLLRVYDRWNTLIFEGDALSGWDGISKVTGLACDDGTYIYTLQLSLESKRNYNFKGTVHLAR